MTSTSRLTTSGGGRVIDPGNGDDVTSCDQAGASANWMPLDPRDQTGGPFAVAADPDGCEHTLTDKSIAIQKGVSNGSNSAGDTLEYALSFQVSDFFAFDGVEIRDVISDGQQVDAGSVPTLEVAGNGYNLPALALTAGNYDVVCNYSGGPGPECTANDPAANDGTTRLTFRVSDEVITRLPTSLGRLVGGCINPSTGTANPDCSLFNNDATTGVLRFRTVIQDDFTDSYLVTPNSGELERRSGGCSG